MHTYSYKLYLDGREESGNHKFPRYTRDELTEMTTYQLRNICYIEKLVPALINTLDREALIETILKFRGAVTHQLIQENVTGGYERVEAVIKKYLRTPFPDNGSIKVPARMTLYSGLSINKRDNYRVKAENGIVESNVLIVNDSLELCGILNLIQDSTQSGHFYLSSAQSIPFRKTANRNYSYLFFRKQDSDYLYKVYTQDKPMPPANLHYYKIPATDLEIRQLEETDAILAIDFGTTNTTAGAYLDQAYISQPCDNDILNGRVRIGAINYVAFPDATQKEEDWIEILPTVVSVADASDPLHIKFHFGYDAVASTRKNGYSSHASVFHGMKRWVNSYTQMEEVMDGQGNSAMTKRSDILRSYLIYCIQMAEQQYKCRFKNLHISSPVKLKSQFIDMFTEILPEYHIETEHSLDEGMAVLYNTIADQIDKNSFLDGEEYNALVIDCGGGTTDLSSCRFRIRDGKISYQIDIQTTYENGDTNFGGNNLTYRIMQYIKIVFADYYSRVKHIRVIDDLIDIPGSEVFRHVDEQGIRSVYQQLEQSYQEAEAYLPTRYKEYENRSRDEYQRVRNNYHFLWDLAENMKKEFFRKTGMLRNRFHAESNDQRNNDLKITAVERWALSVREQGRFADVYEFPDVVFTIKEINQLIKADIYEIVRKFLDDFFQEGKLQDYSIIKLTGQSCRIDLFKEALKEFVPGRSIEFKQKAEDADKVPDLKLSCLRGAIRYLNARKVGFIETSITNHAPIVPYSVTSFTHNKREKILVQHQEKLSQIQGFISRPIEAAEIEFMLKDSEERVRQTYVYQNDASTYRPVVYQEIKERFGNKIPQDDTDSIFNGEVKFFVFSAESDWGFHVVPVARQKEQLYLGKKRFFAFENDLSELDFFDGWK